MNVKRFLFNTFLFIFTVATFCLLCGCELPMDDNTSIVINLGTNRAAGFHDKVDVPGLELTYKIYLKGISNPAINDVIPVSGGTAKKRGVAPGDYKVEVFAYVNGWDYAYCLTDKFTIVAGQTKTVPVNMHRIPNAVVLKDIKKGEVLNFGYVNKDDVVPSRIVEVWNFTGSSLDVSPNAYGSGIRWTPSSVASPITIPIPKDECTEIVIAYCRDRRRSLRQHIDTIMGQRKLISWIEIFCV